MTLLYMRAGKVGKGVSACLVKALCGVSFALHGLYAYSSVDFLFSDRAKELRKEMIRHQIESMLNVDPDELPAVDEVMTGQQLENAARVWQLVSDADNTEATTVVVGAAATDLSSSTAFRDASDLGGLAHLAEVTEKIQSKLPECA